MLNPFSQPITGYEAFNMIVSSQPLSDIVSITTAGKISPLYYIFLHFLSAFIKPEIYTLRWISFLFILLTCIITFFIASHIWSKKTGLYAFLLTLLNPFLGTNYTLIGPAAFSFFTTTLSLLFFINRKRLAFCITTVLALYTNIFSLFVLIPIIVLTVKDYFFDDKKIASKWLKYTAVALLIYTPWIFIITRGMGFRSVSVVFNFQTLSDTMLRFFSNAENAGGVEPLVYIILIIILIRNWFNKVEKSIFFLLLFLFSIAIPWYLSQSYQFTYEPSSLLFIIPATSLILASNKRVPASNIVIILLIILYIQSGFGFLINNKGGFYQNALPYIQKEVQINPVMLTVNNKDLFWVNFFYGLKTPVYNPNNLTLFAPYEQKLITEDSILPFPPPGANKFALITKPYEENILIPGYLPDSMAELKDVNIIWYTKI